MARRSSCGRSKRELYTFRSWQASQRPSADLWLLSTWNVTSPNWEIPEVSNKVWNLCIFCFLAHTRWCSAITPTSAERTICGAKSQIHVGCMKANTTTPVLILYTWIFLKDEHFLCDFYIEMIIFGVCWVKENTKIKLICFFQEVGICGLHYISLGQFSSKIHHEKRRG